MKEAAPGCSQPRYQMVPGTSKQALASAFEAVPTLVLSWGSYGKQIGQHLVVYHSGGWAKFGVLGLNQNYRISKHSNIYSLQYSSAISPAPIGFHQRPMKYRGIRERRTFRWSLVSYCRNIWNHLAISCNHIRSQ